MDISGALIVIQERRAADGLDAYIPVILREEAIYDPDLDRFFLDLPLDEALSVRPAPSALGLGRDMAR